LSVVASNCDKRACLPARTLQAQATAAVMSVMHVSSYRLGYIKPEEINTSSTIWKVMCDVTNMIIHNSSVGCPSTFQVNFKDLNLQEGAPTKMLLLKDGHCRSGTISADAWNSAEPFVYCPYKP
jgi:penicillin V acylase-like amidase (Ntn superfamily)